MDLGVLSAWLSAWYPPTHMSVQRDSLISVKDVKEDDYASQETARYLITMPPVLVLVVLLWAVILASATGTAAARSVSTTSLPRPVLFPTIQQAKQLPSTRAGNSAVLGNGDLAYHGGPLQDANPVAILIFWGPTWQNGSGGITSDGQVVQNYFSQVARTTFSNILTQYYDTKTHLSNWLTYGGTYLDASTPPTDSSCGGPTIEDTAISAEVQTIITQNLLPPSTGETFFVFTPQGDYVNDGYGDCSDQTNSTSFCSYHGAVYASLHLRPTQQC